MRERKRKLFQKAAANAQRRRREALLASLPTDLAKVLADADTIYSPEVDAMIRTYYPATAVGYGAAELHPPSYSYREVVWPDQALAVFDQEAFRNVNGPAILGLDSPTQISLDLECYLVTDLPLFRVRAEFAVGSIRTLWQATSRFISLTSDDQECGVVVDSRTGYLEDRSNPEEIVYEVAAWGKWATTQQNELW